MATIVANNVAAANRIQEMRTATARAHFASSASGSTICPTVPTLPGLSPRITRPGSANGLATALMHLQEYQLMTTQATILSAARNPQRAQPTRARLEIRSMVSGIAAIPVRVARVTPYTMPKDGPGVAIPTLTCASGTRHQRVNSGRTELHLSFAQRICLVSRASLRASLRRYLQLYRRIFFAIYIYLYILHYKGVIVRY